MKGLLFLNGAPPSRKILSEIDYGYFTVCADGAYSYLKNYCQPDILVGDFDSADESDMKAKKIMRLNVEKDFTDGHVAMQCLIDEKVTSVDIYGSFGLRRDHELSNYSLLFLAAKNGINAVMRDENFDVYFACSAFSAPAIIGKTVSLVPFSDSVHILFTQGLKYALVDEILNKLHIKGISNVAKEEIIRYEINSGSALIFIER